MQNIYVTYIFILLQMRLGEGMQKTCTPTEITCPGITCLPDQMYVLFFCFSFYTYCLYARFLVSFVFVFFNFLMLIVSPPNQFRTDSYSSAGPRMNDGSVRYRSSDSYY